MPDPNDTLRTALEMLAHENPVGWPAFTAIGWDPKHKVLSFRRHYDEWVNVWLKEPHEGGVPVVEQNNGAAADTMILWAESKHTFFHLRGWHGGWLKGLTNRLWDAEALLDEVPELLLNAGADENIMAAWKERVREYHDDG